MRCKNTNLKLCKRWNSSPYTIDRARTQFDTRNNKFINLGTNGAVMHFRIYTLG